MATLAPSVSIHRCRLKCRATGSSKPIATAHFLGGKKMTDGFEKVNVERNLFCGQVMENVITTHTWPFDLRVFAASRVSKERTERLLTTGTEVDEQQKASTYLFRTENGGQVKVFVRMENGRFVVYIEASPFQQRNSNDGLVLSWGVYRADSSRFMPRDFKNPASNAKIKPIETPFKQTSSGKFSLELYFEVKHSPFYISFLLKCPSNAESSCLEIKSYREANFVVPVGFSSGSPTPLGLLFSKDGSVNFALATKSATSVVLCLYKDATSDTPTLELDLDPYVNRSGDIWHASIGSDSTFVSYGYRCKGDKKKFDAERVLLDPYVKMIGDVTPNRQSGSFPQYLGQLCEEPPFEWSGDIRPNLPIEKLMVYRLNVKHFTEHKSSGVSGTFSGLSEKSHHFKDLGVNAVLLEPIFGFDEQKGPYYPFHFFSPTNMYGSSGDSISAINSMKEMVKKLHAENIEVLLEVDFTHTPEGGALRGIDYLSYCANGTMNCNYPMVQQLILDSLRHWVIEFHVDGFCFMNASSLLRGVHGESLSRPPLVEAIAFDPILSKTKVIADFWDPHDLVEEKTRFPHWKRWAEMNSNFCTDVRNFLRGKGLLSGLATRLCGSGDIFSDGRGPAFSFNFIARNFGLSLVDLVSFSSAEISSELSWNCGEEGPTTRTIVLERRLKQIRNFLFVLYVSLGVPVLNMGDECGQSSRGSTAYADRSPFDWNTLKSGFGVQITQYISFFTSLRTRRSDLLQKRNFLKEENIDWYGSDQFSPKWEDPSCKFLAMTLKADAVQTKLSPESSDIRSDLFIAFNAADHAETVTLPPPPEKMAWYRLVDTALPFPGFFSTDGELVVEQMAGFVVYEMKSHSCVLFESISCVD